LKQTRESWKVNQGAAGFSGHPATGVQCSFIPVPPYSTGTNRGIGGNAEGTKTAAAPVRRPSTVCVGSQGKATRCPSALRPGKKIPECCIPVGLALDPSIQPPLCGSSQQQDLPISHVPHNTAEALTRGGIRSWIGQAYNGPFPEAQFCRPFDRGRLRHQDRPGTARARKRTNDDDLYPHCQEEQDRGDKPVGKALPAT
jgi:hypothetical protein